MNPNPQRRMPQLGIFRTIRMGFEFRRNYIPPLEKLFKEFGDHVAFAGGRNLVVAFHPDSVERVLRSNAKNYLKAPDMRELHPVLGQGLLTSEGEFWKEHRRLIGPEFQPKKVEAFIPVIQRHLAKTMDQLARTEDVVDVARAVAKLTYGIAGECFFGAEVESSSDKVYELIEFTSKVSVRRMATPFKIPLSLPVPEHVKFHRGVRELNEIVYGIIDQRLRQMTSGADVLSRLTRSLSRRDLRDEVMTLLLAGHETTGNLLAWTLYLLGKNPEVQNDLRDEVAARVAGEVPSFDELKGLPLTKMVLEESMRIYPPAATLGRLSLGPDELGGFAIAKDTTVNLAQWITHRHPEFWEDPEEFRPERFLDSKVKDRHPYAYFPFGGGPRECIGKNMAMTEAIFILAGLIKNFYFHGTDREVQVHPLITVRPHPGVYMKVRRVHSSMTVRQGDVSFL